MIAPGPRVLHIWLAFYVREIGDLDTTEMTVEHVPMRLGPSTGRSTSQPYLPRALGKFLLRVCCNFAAVSAGDAGPLASGGRRAQPHLSHFTH
jgi:hypothetical protein